ncbi:MAG: 3-deoxy-D-manno-octulosonate 8-phosphate phosphatase [Acidobacteria bacterium]|nr:3-deoxy-D-manno-octulosonate 8-phosphate phosphatase [Acidobacteriota bacterium]
MTHPHHPPAGRALGDEEFERRARDLRWLLTDVDGVLTDGAMLYGPAGEEMKRFHVRDGLALKLARSTGLRVGLLSARGNRAVEIRARELGLDRLMLGQRDKVGALEALLGEEGISAGQIAYLGDDLPDLGVLGRVGLAFCPADAAAEVCEVAHRVLTTLGGHGAAREAVELILKARGQWRSAVEPFYQRKDPS